MSNHTRNIALAVLMLASAGAGYESTAFSAPAREDVFSFDMWCLEMKLYASQRCDARRSDDVKAYEQYRADVEKFDSARNTRAERDRELQQKLNPDSSSAKPSNPVR